MFSEILQYTTNTFVCFKFIIMLPVLACQSILRYTFLYVLEIYFELFFIGSYWNIVLQVISKMIIKLNESS